METDPSINSLSVPIVFLVFNRPETTRKVFSAIAQARPRTLFLVADGPRTEEERVRTQEVRSIIQNVTWPCNVHTNFAERNLGCRKRVSSGITWAFEHTDRAIILEDDTLPHPSFFRFCEELLETYASEERIMHISGATFQSQKPAASYSFSRIPHIWGWATWRRAWRHYDAELSDWPSLRATPFPADAEPWEPAQEYWRHLFEQTWKQATKKNDTWDAQWVYACLKRKGIAITPSVNMVSNIGFGEYATRTTHTDDIRANRPACAMPFPLRRPHTIAVDHNADRSTYTIVFRIHATLAKRARWAVKKHLPAVYRVLKKIRSAVQKK